jgi:hypothetical protein
MATGQIEDAATDLSFRMEEFDKLSTSGDARQRATLDALRPLLRNLMYRKYVLEGNFSEAGKMLDAERQAVGTVGEDTPLSPEQTRYLKNHAPLANAPAILPVLPAIGMLGTSPMTVLHDRGLRNELLKPFVERQQILNSRRDLDSGFYWQRGLLFLMEGDIADAKKRLLASRQPGAKEWGIPDRTHDNAETYLRLIEHAEKSGAK